MKATCILGLLVMNTAVSSAALLNLNEGSTHTLPGTSITYNVTRTGTHDSDLVLANGEFGNAGNEAFSATVIFSSAVDITLSPTSGLLPRYDAPDDLTLALTGGVGSFDNIAGGVAGIPAGNPDNHDWLIDAADITGFTLTVADPRRRESDSVYS